MAAKVKSETNESVMANDGEAVRLGNRTFYVRELPVARLKRFQKVWNEFFGDLTALLQKADLTEASTMTAIFGLLEDKPGEILEVIVPGFDRELMDDEENGPTIPQIKRVVDLSISVNGLDVLRRAMPFLTETLTQALRIKILRSAIQMEEKDTDDTEKTS